jgi:hypothetical protein
VTERERGTNTYLGSLTSKTKRDFGDGERKKEKDKYIFMKSHFADEERLREQIDFRENFYK